MEENGDVEDVPTLSAETFAALQDFYKEQDLRDQERSEIKANGGKSGGIEDFQEDWQLSQFWYDEKTAQTLGIYSLRFVQCHLRSNYLGS